MNMSDLKKGESMKRSASHLYFYSGDTLSTIKQGSQSYTLLRSADMPLAEQHADPAPNPGLLTINDKRAMLNARGEENAQSPALIP